MNNTHVPTGKTFKITTISELSLVATEANIDFLLADLKLCMLAAIQVNAMHKAICGDDASQVPMIHFAWIDDGLNNLEGIKFLDEKGDEQFRINGDSFKNMGGE